MSQVSATILNSEEVLWVALSPPTESISRVLLLCCLFIGLLAVKKLVNLVCRCIMMASQLLSFRITCYNADMKRACWITQCCLVCDECDWGLRVFILVVFLDQRLCCPRALAVRLSAPRTVNSARSFVLAPLSLCLPLSLC